MYSSITFLKNLRNVLNLGWALRPKKGHCMHSDNASFIEGLVKQNSSETPWLKESPHILPLHFLALLKDLSDVKQLMKKRLSILSK